MKRSVKSSLEFQRSSVEWPNKSRVLQAATCVFLILNHGKQYEETGRNTTCLYYVVIVVMIEEGNGCTGSLVNRLQQLKTSVRFTYVCGVGRAPALSVNELFENNRESMSIIVVA